MTRIIDLSLPIEDHFRWPVERRVSWLPLHRTPSDCARCPTAGRAKF